ncbi:hypothetical protein K438DRAFT_1995536 [Mycena galopus ATCC 62051]|nr:hypothetical protein K438DRAFT_1995536 [Mycena galopus ATCC 62051]
MDHPYSGAASYIYANEHPYTPVDARSKDPYGKLPSFVPSPSTAASTPSSRSRRSHDSGWSTEGTYTRIQRPTHDSDAPPFRRTFTQSQSAPRIPLGLRVPISHPYSPYDASTNTSWFHPDRGARAEDQTSQTHPQMRSNSLPGRSRGAPASKTGSGSAISVSTAAPATLPLPMKYIHPQTRSTSLPGHSRASQLHQAPRPTAPKMRMTPYERDGDPLSLRRSAFVPYDASERGSAADSPRSGPAADSSGNKTAEKDDKPPDGLDSNPVTPRRECFDFPQMTKVNGELPVG